MGKIFEVSRKLLSPYLVSKNIVMTSRMLPSISRGYAVKKSFIQRYQDWFSPTVEFPSPPYKFVCQIGDPVLRQSCDLVHESIIDTPGFQSLISQMWDIHKRYDLVGLSAPQIGLPLQVAVIGCTEEDCEKLKDKYVTPVPHRVLINPRMKIMDYKNKITSHEGCASMCSYAAQVTRFGHIQVEALNEKGVKKNWDSRGYEARIIQHEIDHLQGTLFVDKMEPKTLECLAWQYVNRHQGQGYISFSPPKQTMMAQISRRIFLR